MALLEDELDGMLHDAGFDTRQATAIALRLGLDGGGGTWLRAAAHDTGYSHERVRQLEVALRTRLRTRRPQLPVLRRAAGFVEGRTPDERGHVAALLAETGLSAAPFDPAGVITAARIARIDVKARVRGRFVVGPDRPDPDEWLVGLARETASTTDEVTVRELSRRSSLEADRVRRLLDGSNGMRWVGDGRTALWPRLPVVERRLALILSKVLSVTGSISLADVDVALRRIHRPVLLSPRVLLTLCRSLRWLQVEDGGLTVRSLVRFEQSRVLSPVELELAQIFNAAGPVLSFRDAVTLGGERGLNRNSVGVYVTHTPIVKKLARGRYALVGA